MRRADATREVVHEPWTPTTKLVALALLALADREGVVAMTQAELGAKLSITDRRVRSAITEMGTSRLIVVSERGRFRLLFDPEIPDQADPRIRYPTGSSGSTDPVDPVAPPAPASPPSASRTVSENSSLSEISSDSKTVEVLDLCEVGTRASGNAPEVSAAARSKTSARNGAKKLDRWRRVPRDWSPGLDHAQIARDLGVDLGLELAKFRDHEFQKPKSDADATFRNWLRSAKPSGRPSAGRAFNRAEDQLQAQLERVRELEAEEARERAGT